MRKCYAILVACLLTGCADKPKPDAMETVMTMDVACVQTIDQFHQLKMFSDDLPALKRVMVSLAGKGQLWTLLEGTSVRVIGSDEDAFYVQPLNGPFADRGPCLVPYTSVRW